MSKIPPSTDSATPRYDPTKPYDPPELDQYVGADYWDVHAEFETVADAVLENLPHPHPVRMAFLEIAEHQHYSDELPRRDAVRHAVEMFYALPRAERRRVLNGWDVQPSRLRTNRALLVSRAKIECIFNGMEFLPSGGEAKGWLTQYASESVNRVSVQIRVGTRKMDAVETLRRLARQLDIDWEKTVAALHDREADEDEKALDEAMTMQRRRNQPRPAEIQVTPGERRWWEAKGFSIRVTTAYADGAWHAVECVRTVRDVTIVVGTIAICVMPDGPGDEAEDIANRIAANPTILDTMTDPRVIDCRNDRGGQAAEAGQLTDAAFDAFADHTLKTLDALRVAYDSLAHPVLMPDGATRALYAIREQTGEDARPEVYFIGRKVEGNEK